MLGKLRLYLKLWEPGLASTSMWPEGDKEDPDLEDDKPQRKFESKRVIPVYANEGACQYRRCSFSYRQACILVVQNI